MQRSRRHDVDDDTVIDQFGEITETIGPNGETPTDAADVVLTEEQKETIRGGNHRVAILWHELSGWCQAIQDGMIDVFDDLDIEMTTTADAGLRRADAGEPDRERCSRHSPK